MGCSSCTNCDHYKVVPLDNVENFCYCDLVMRTIEYGADKCPLG